MKDAQTAKQAIPSTDTPVLVPMPAWVVSDTHFGHSGILEYCPWRSTWAADIGEHDSAIIAAWRSCVHDDEWILHLGDFSLGEKVNAERIRRQLPGRIILVRGNHDRSLSAMRDAGFDVVCSAARIEHHGRHWIARHNPSAFSPREAKLAQGLLHGHTHGNGYHDHICASVRAKAIDCSLDALRSLAPVSWENVAKRSCP